MPTSVVNGIRLNYEQTGHGPDVVMVHGLATNLAFWYLKTVPLLRREFRVTLFDLRGHGKSERTPDGYTPASMASDLEALIDALGADRAHVVGHSYGGVVALEYALRRPERVASLTIVDSRLQALQPAPRLKESPHYETWKRELERSGLPAPDPEETSDYHVLAQEWLAEQPGRPPARTTGGAFVPFFGAGRRGARQWHQLLESTTAKSDFRDPGPALERIRGLRAPTCAIFGELSHCLPTCLRLRAAIGCRVVIIPGVGHFFPLTRPRAFVATLRGFLLFGAQHGVEPPVELDDEPTRTSR